MEVFIGAYTSRPPQSGTWRQTDRHGAVAVAVGGREGGGRR